MYKKILILIIALAPVAAFSQGMYSLTYDISYALGSSNDYISAPSFRGVTLIDGRNFVTTDFSIGGQFSWHVFYQEEEGEFTEDNITLTGKQYKYVNSFPVMLTGHYYFGDGSSTTYYVGTGIGAVSYEARTEMGLYYSGDAKWHFGINPQVGVLIPMSPTTDLHINLKYQQVFKAGDYPSNQYLSLGIGFAWW